MDRRDFMKCAVLVPAMPKAMLEVLAVAEKPAGTPILAGMSGATAPWWNSAPLADPLPLTVERLNAVWRAGLLNTQSISRAQVEKLWPSRGRS